MARRLWLLTLILNIMTVITRAERPSKQNRESIKEKVINWYQNNPVKIRINRLQGGSKEKDKTLHINSIKSPLHQTHQRSHTSSMDSWGSDFGGLLLESSYPNG